MEVRKKHQNNVGKKRGLPTAIESEISAKKSQEKIQNEKNATKNRKKGFQPSRKRPSATFSGKYFNY